MTSDFWTKDGGQEEELIEVCVNPLSDFNGNGIRLSKAPTAAGVGLLDDPDGLLGRGSDPPTPSATLRCDTVRLSRRRKPALLMSACEHLEVG